jgi:hypothetical protein
MHLMCAHLQIQAVDNLLFNVLLAVHGFDKSIDRSRAISEANALLSKVC